MLVSKFELFIYIYIYIYIKTCAWLKKIIYIYIYKFFIELRFKIKSNKQSNMRDKDFMIGGNSVANKK